MEPRHLFTIRWTQPYANTWERPYLRQLHNEFEQLIEHQLEEGDFTQAKQLIERIMKL